MATNLDTIDQHFMKVHTDAASRPGLATRHPGQGPLQNRGSNSLIENVCGTDFAKDHETELRLNIQVHRNEGKNNKENAGATQNMDRALYA